MVIVIALDGADWDIIDPLLEAGSMPVLQSVLEKEGSFRGILESTMPPVTFPAWNTFLSGVNPGMHGILDFARWIPGTYSVKFCGSGSLRRVPTFPEYLASAGKKVACLGIPGTWPPMELEGGFVLSGFDAPVSVGADADFAFPVELYRKAAGDRKWVYADIDEFRVSPGWHEKALKRLLEGMSVKEEITLSIMAEAPWDLFMVHIGETDTVGHHFYAHHDPKSPRRPERVSALEARAVETVYRAADSFIGKILDRAGDCSLLIAGDHGMGGASDRSLYLNRVLNREGFLFFENHIGGKLIKRAENALRDSMVRYLPMRLKESLVRRFRASAGSIESRRRLGGISMKRSLAFSEELTYAPSIRLNIRDREPLGIIAPEEAEKIREMITDSLLSIRDEEDDIPVIRDILFREEVMKGPALSEAPDLYVVPSSPDGYTYTVLSSGGRPGPCTGRLAGKDKLGGKGRGPTGIHRAESVIIISDPGLINKYGLGTNERAGKKADSPVAASTMVPIGACAATIMSMCGMEAPDDFEWESLVFPGKQPSVRAGPEISKTAYTADQEAEVAGRLRAFGYFD